ncbi:MAG: hypothetical protein NWQ44_00950 [Flavobacteriales bacterium]|nr:hypothetical protein [Flavobacteriales bacterium]MDP4732253.1 hypothetical protein [Flavobacteriales bacterium]MDP4950276.1 hypothetical protein [Flavobacteriales bacterium]
MKGQLFIALLALAFCVDAKAQYFLDIFSFNRQAYNIPSGAQTGDLFVNAFIPKVLKSGNTFFVRAHYEKLDLKNDSLSASYSSVTLPVGMQVQLKNPKWKFTGLIIPKIAGADLGAAFSNVFQFGAYSLFTVTESEKFRYKFGLYYNREFFGNFFVPLVGIDWKVTDRFSLFGTLPQSFKASYTIVPSRVNAGLAFRSMTRSFRGEDNNTFVRYNELQFKTFFDFYVTPKNVVYIEGGYFLGKTPLLYNNAETKNPVNSDLLKEGKAFPIINAGWALRF